MPKILIADDNIQITSILEEYAKREGFTSVVAYDGADALVKFEQEKPDVVLLDVMMPEKNGFDVCREIRRTSNVPIIMVTARGEDFERIMGLEIGADDYIVKPFSPGEVIARVKAVLRRIARAEGGSAQLFEFEGLRIDSEDYSVTVGGASIDLTKKEFEILWTLAKNRNRVFSRDNLLDSVWGHDYAGDNRTVDSHIKRLRAKLDDHEHPGWEIRTIWGVGYKFEVLQ